MSRLLGKSLLGNSTLTKISSRAEILEFHNPPILEFLCNSNSLIHLKLSTSKYGLRISNEFMENVSQILLKNPVLKSLKIYVNSNPNSLKILYNGLSKNCTLESFGKALEKKNGEEKDFESQKSVFFCNFALFFLRYKVLWLGSCSFHGIYFKNYFFKIS